MLLRRLNGAISHSIIRFLYSKKKVISFSQPVLFQEEEEAVLKTIRSGRLVMGPNVEKFEEMVASFSGQKHAIAVTSGTSALTLSLTAMGVDQNSLVVVPAYTWVATYNAPKLLGATVRLADIDPNTFCLNSFSTKQILENSSSPPSTLASQQKTVVIPVHMFGNRCSSDLGQYDLVLGDGCCSFGGLGDDGRRCGNWNEIECFSFHPRKLITTGEGGMILCSDDSFANKLRIQRDHGAYRSKEQRHQTVHGGDMIPEFPEVGYNLRLTDLQGALGVVQMNRIEMIIDSRRKVAARYDAGLQELSDPALNSDLYLKLPAPELQSGGQRVLTMYSLQLRSKKLDEFLLHLLPSLPSSPSSSLSSSLSSSSSSPSSSLSSSSSSSPSSSLSSFASATPSVPITNEFLKETLKEICYLNQIKSQLMAQLVLDGVTSRPPMISLLDVSHIQRDHLSLTGEDLRDNLIKLKSFPGTFLTSQLTFALPLHPLLSSDEVDHVISRLFYHFTNTHTRSPDLTTRDMSYTETKTEMKMSSKFISKALEISACVPHDFTIQYPIRREYFKSFYLIPKNKTNITSTSSSPSSPSLSSSSSSSSSSFSFSSFSSSSSLSSSSSSLAPSNSDGNGTMDALPYSPQPTSTPPLSSYQSLCNTSLLPPPVELISNKDLLLYLHIPFCKSKCHYCNFAVDTRQSFELKDRYTNRLAQQVQQWSSVILDSKYNVNLSGIDIGGGTPTLLSENHLEIILTSLQPLLQHQQQQRQRQQLPPDSSFLSIETTPEIAATEPSKLNLLYQFGIQRISVGIQTSNETLLCEVNRSSPSSSLSPSSSQSNQQIDLAMTNLRQIGYQRINLDLIFGLPNQSMEQWKADLWKVVQLNPDSITTYDCVYKGKGRGINSILQREQQQQQQYLQQQGGDGSGRPSWKLYGEMYDYGYQYLHSQGYHAPYGSVNFSRIPNETGTSRYFENRLLRGKSYIGLGNYASTMIDRYWIFSPHSVEGWLAETNPSSGGTVSGTGTETGETPRWLPYNAYSLPIEERVSKYLLSSLSFGFIDEQYFQEIFPSWTLQNFYSNDIFEELVEKRRWLRYEEREKRFYLNDHCFQFLPQIRAMFHSKKSLEWFESNVLNLKKEKRKE